MQEIYDTVEIHLRIKKLHQTLIRRHPTGIPRPFWSRTEAKVAVKHYFKVFKHTLVKTSNKEQYWTPLKIPSQFSITNYI